MLVPALFVAETARSYLGRSLNAYDVIVFVGPDDVKPQEETWAKQRGIEISPSLDFSSLSDMRSPLKRLTNATLARLLLPEQLSGRYDRILYLDADVMIQDDVGRIYSLDMGGFALAAVPAARYWIGPSALQQETVAHFRALGMSEPFRYFNSGVLYIDVEKWNRDEIGRRALNFIGRNPSLCIWPDEDALNAVLDGKIAELSPLWNMRARSWVHRRVRSAANPVIVHYDGPNKPWQRFGKGRRLFQFERAYRSYKKFLLNSPWPGWLDDKWTSEDVRDGLAHEMGLWTAWIGGREAPFRRLREERAYAKAFLRYSAESPFVDVDQGIVKRTGSRLHLAPATESGPRR
jgi:lipopolysaccharide biosynthesis glycosyltransferase